MLMTGFVRFSQKEEENGDEQLKYSSNDLFVKLGSEVSEA